MDDRLRLSDADRDHAAALLRDHFAAGRLAAGELDERLAAILDSRTLGDLRRVLDDLPGAAAASTRPSSAPPRHGQLARGYRRLLACYPAWYRRAHEEEILAVLMTGAPPGKRRPGIAEAADLLWGALRIRCQPARADGGEPAWRDALAVLTVIVPLIVVARPVLNETQFVLLQHPPGLLAGFPQWVLNALAAPLALAALVPLGLRMRRLAALAGAGLLVWLLFGLPGQAFGIAIGDAPAILATALVTAALAASPGPRRGLQIVTWKHAVIVVIATTLVCTSVIPMDRATRLVTRLIVIAVIAAGMALASSLGRWLVLLLAIAAYPLLLFFGLSLFPPGFRASLAPAPLIAAYYLPSLALVILAVVAARRASSRSAKHAA